MYFQIPVRTNFYNFEVTANLGGSFFILRFTYMDRKETYFLDILSESGELLEGGIACATNKQLNRNILPEMQGVLFFQTTDPKLSYADRLNLGDKVKLFYYQEDERVI